VAPAKAAVSVASGKEPPVNYPCKFWPPCFPNPFIIARADSKPTVWCGGDEKPAADLSPLILSHKIALKLFQEKLLDDFGR